MPPVLRLDNVSLAFGSRPLLEQASLQVEPGERVCIVGRNGEGKSSLMRLVGGEALPDAGQVWIRPGARVAHLPQDIVAVAGETVREVVAGGLPDVAALLADYHATSANYARTHSEADGARLARLMSALDAAQGWQIEQRVDTALSHLGLDGEVAYEALSGGWRRRALLGRALVCEPELLLLDEPTNHLDIEAIEWLEQFLLGFGGALLFVSHDRRFVNTLATRVIDLDRGTLSSWPGNYDAYVQKKAEQLANEAKENALFDKKLAQEEVWIRKGIEARRTRNEGRVRALKAMREERRDRRDRVGRLAAGVQEAGESGKLVFEAEDADVAYGDRRVIRGFSTRVLRGDRIGIVGPNGAGKSTLIKLLLGELEASGGKVLRGTKLEVAYFDQQRATLDLDATVMDNVADRTDYVCVNGENQHVSGYLRNFLFRPDQLKTPAGALSGGERNRLLLARLFAQPANLLVLDEPTNDLDIDTLELLQELVADFSGTLLLVSHDRAFLDAVVTNLLVLEGDGRVQDFVGGYSDWAAWRDARDANRSRGAPPSAARPSPPAPPSLPATQPAKRKLSYKEQRELATLTTRMEELEAEKTELERRIAEPSFYAQDHATVSAELSRVASLDAELDAALARWVELEG
ncbi:MAG: hypothetical protein RLZZ393_2023 [Pseudomonadota bacterium]|jgi:ATP-binding cassette subfamily F protein uup